MKEQLITFETAKLAKEKGFKIPSHSYYFEDGEFKEFELIETHGYYGDEFTVSRSEFYENWNDTFKTTKNGDRCFGCDKSPAYLETFSAPTQSLLQKWLKEEKRIIVLPYLYDVAREDIFSYQIIRRINNLKCGTPYLSYEEALEKGLQEALKLIEL